jgi:hypothetical protein
MMIFSIDPDEDDGTRSCIDCCNFSEDGPDGYCKLAEHPPVIEFCSTPDNWEDADMSRCPGFVEDN